MKINLDINSNSKTIQVNSCQTTKDKFSHLINSQSLEDTQVGYISQKYTLDKYMYFLSLLFEIGGDLRDDGVDLLMMVLISLAMLEGHQ